MSNLVCKHIVQVFL